MPNFLVFSTIIPKLFGSKIILDIHDLMPEIFSVKFKLGINHWLIRLLYFEERISALYSNHIIATNSFHVERFKKNRIKNKNIIQVINVADENVFYPPENKNFNEEKLIIAYPSTLAKRLGIDNLLEAIEILKSKNLKVHLNIYGDGEYREEIVKKITTMKIDDCVDISDTFIGLEKLSFELDKAHVGVIPLPSNVSNDIAMPVKIYEFFAKKVCVVATGLPLLESCFHDSIVFFEEANSIDLANKINELYEDRALTQKYAHKGYDYFSKTTWTHYKKQYQALIEK